VEIVAHDQMLGDHYDPIHKRVVLAKIFTERRWRPWVLRHTSASMQSNTGKRMRLCNGGWLRWV
jgi:hypothetical protein